MEYAKLAQDFVNKTKRLFDIDMNIINEKGIIISSSQVERIGDFHEMAFHMIENNIEYSHNEDLSTPLKGTRIGVNMLLKKNSIPYGVIGITGVPKENEKMIHVLKYFFETLEDYAQNSLFTSVPQTDELAFSLFIEQPANYSKILNLFDQVHRDPAALRLPVLLSISDTDKTNKIFYSLKNQFSDDRQNLVFMLNSYEIVCLIHTAYQESPASIIGEITRALDGQLGPGCQYHLLYTLPIDDITHYFLSYCQLSWLKKLHVYDQTKKAISITDDFTPLVLSSQHWDNYNNILTYYKKKLAAFHAEKEFTEIAKALILHDMNYAQAANSLFVHKNTIVFRMNKLKTILGIDPYNNTSHMALFHYLYYFIQIDDGVLPSFQKFYNKYHI